MGVGSVCLRKLVLLLVVVNISFGVPKDYLVGQSIYTVLHIIDWKQTLEIASGDKYEEKNPIPGSHPSKGRVNTYFVATLMANWLIGYWLYKVGKPYYYFYIRVMIGMEGATVWWNHRIGIRISF